MSNDAPADRCVVVFLPLRLTSYVDSGLALLQAHALRVIPAGLTEMDRRFLTEMNELRQLLTKAKQRAADGAAQAPALPKKSDRKRSRT